MGRPLWLRERWRGMEERVRVGEEDVWGGVAGWEGAPMEGSGSRGTATATADPKM